ncbi:MAG TPA: TetR/AcrR family transcriptional regulator [Anaerolineales bacterium]|nr:TetR/AcrR family transcriptional regulator [Anaerolineales bacterium]
MSLFSDPEDATLVKDTRQRILEAAVKVFSTKGYHETRVDEIVEASSTSKGAVYFHFPGKQEVFLTLIDELAALLESRLAQAIAHEEHGVEKVDAALRVCLETFGRYQKLAKIFLIQAVGLGVAFEEKRNEILDRFVRVIQVNLDQAVSEGHIDPIDTEIVAYAWMGALNEVIIRWVLTGEPSPERVHTTLRLTLLRSVGVSPERIAQLPDLR